VREKKNGLGYAFFSGFWVGFWGRIEIIEDLKMAGQYVMKSYKKRLRKTGTSF
jgi:hypothetical protein